MIVSAQIVPRLSTILFAAAFGSLLSSNYWLFIATTAIGTGIGLILLYLVVDEPEALRFSWILAAVLLIAYAGGSLSTWYNSASFNDFAILTKQRPAEALSGTLAFVYACCASALIAGRFEQPIVRSDDSLPEPGSFAVLLSAIGLILIVVAYLVDELGFEGLKADVNTQRIPILGAIASLIAAPLAGLLSYMYGRSDSKFLRLYCAISSVIILMSIVPSGRRPIFLALIMVAFGLSLSGRLRRWSPIRKLLTAATAALVGYAISAFFFAIRLSVWELGPTSSLADQIALAWQFMTSPTLETRFDALLYDNLRERTFVLGYLADLVEATQASAPLYGQALLFYLKLSVPSALDPSKVDVLAIPQIEIFAHPLLGLPVLDQANTILTDGVTDFGLAGGFAYLAGLVLLLYGSHLLFRKFNGPFTFLITSMTLIHLALKPEITLSEYLVTIRNLIWIVPLLFACEYIFGLISKPTLRGSTTE